MRWPNNLVTFFLIGLRLPALALKVLSVANQTSNDTISSSGKQASRTASLRLN
jgi:hypothetical protein